MLACSALSRFLAGRFLDSLDNTCKLLVLRAFSGMSRWSNMPLFVIIIAAIAGFYLLPQYSLSITSLFLSLLIASLVITHVFIKRRLSAIRLPPEHIGKILLFHQISHLGLVLFMLAIVAGILLTRAPGTK